MNRMIEVEGLSKRYRLGDYSSKTLSGDIAQMVRRKRSANDAQAGSGRNAEFWSLRDLHFAVNEGDVFGIVGNNGAGKSTLLKILSKITKPTRGNVRLNGRVASLLEVGTGFHPDLSGRENIFLNGAILGMSREEIRKKFDEIVAFAGVGSFLDTPVKRYSSGMYVRLGFAVAAHLEPEILVVDEVLAVGDHAFQQKCLGKMKDISTEGRTVLFVSHSLPAVKRLCNRGLLLDHGQLVLAGDMEDVLAVYQESDTEKETGIRSRIPEGQSGFFTNWRLLGDDLPGSHRIFSRSQISFLCGFTSNEQLGNVEVRLLVRYQQLVIAHVTSKSVEGNLFLNPGSYTFEFSFDFPIRDAQFDVGFVLTSYGRTVDQWDSATRLTVVDRLDTYVEAGMLNPELVFRVHSGSEMLEPESLG